MKAVARRTPRRKMKSLSIGFIFLFVALFLSPLGAFAQVGPCPPSGTCPSGQSCLTPPEGGPQCFQLCTPSGSVDPALHPGCPSGSVCGGADTALGANVCISLDGAVADFASADAPAEGAGASGGSTEAVPTGSAETKPFTSITPKLGVDIPGVEFTPATKQGTYVYVPFLAQYISGAYRYAIGIVLVTAIVMVVWGGFRYLVGSGFENVTRGKEIIRDAIAGMLLVIAAYLILQTINPATLNLSVFKLGAVTEEAIELSQRTTIVDTRPEGSYEDAPSASFGECPVSLTAAVTDQSARKGEFLEKVAAIVGTGDIRQRVLRVAEASGKCGVSFGSCGKTAETIFAAAGHTYRDDRGRQTKHEPSGVATYLDSIKCASGMERDARNACVSNAKQLAYSRMSETVAGWPEAWTNELIPGDRIAIFNANSSVAGLHSAIFMGWAGNGRAQVVQGAWQRLVNAGTICITSACTNPSPLIRVFQPVDD